MDRIYLDNAATTQPAPEVIEAMLSCLRKTYGNPSSLHSVGLEARGLIESARRKMAAFINASPDEVIFTGSGTESNNTVIKGIALSLQDKGNHIISTAIEHHAVHAPLSFLEEQGFKVTYLPNDDEGLVDPDDLKKAISEKTILVSVMHANNEIGTIEPIRELGAICRERGIYFHTDAVQTFGHLPIDVQEMNIDLLSASAHKLYGPKGIGLLYARKGVKIKPLLHGGDQEKRRRASTENTPGIAGFAKAVELAATEMEREALRQTRLRDRLISALLELVPESRLNGHPKLRLPNNINMSFAYVEGEAMLLNLDMQGISVSTGSACTSASLEPSHVLAALGLTQELSHGSLRFSLSRSTTEEEIEQVISTLTPIIAQLRAMSPLYRKQAVK
ncbi:cysteine desulfurase [Syntrophus gentianae]|uniref:Cysteine desulfurase IscS n=1 Tax=Syntrophus gentianae TaxID=43775 RepID=A0A1H7XTT3_9BACT|nr:cysteine desulfurase NifS [Syntrophus gentianae]SEM37286.1 cysteine desulfurase [Syntrophus gentianae]